MTVPYAFGAATSAIPLSQLDSNFNTPITLGNTAIQLGNTVTTLNNMTLANVTISSGNVTITNVTVTTANATTVNTTTLIATTANVTTGNVTNLISGNVSLTGGTITGTPISGSTGSFTTLTTSSTVTLNGGTAGGVAYLDGSKVLTSGSALTFDGTKLGIGVASPVRRLDVSGQIRATTGTVFAEVDADSSAGVGFFGTASNHPIGFKLNDSEVGRWTSTGLGIGTSSPGVKLDVVGELRTQNTSPAGITVKRTDGVNANGWLNFVGSDDVVDGSVRMATDVANALTFLTASTERLRIDSSGNLGIGTSSPKEKIDSRGAAVFSGDNATGTNAFGTAEGVLLSTGSGVARITAVSNGNNNVNLVLRSLNAGSAASSTLMLDSSGNLGLGVTPSAWSSNYRAMQLGQTGVVTGRSDTEALYIFSNAFVTGGNTTYVVSDFATAYQMQDGKHLWSIAPSGTAGNAITFTQAMTLDASGNLGVGITNPSSYNSAAYQIVAGSTSTSGGITIVGGTSSYSSLHFADGTSGADAYRGDIAYNHANNSMAFYTDGTERARIDSSGNLYLGATSGARGGSTTRQLVKLGTSQSYLEIQSASTSSTADAILFSDGSTGNYGQVGYNHSADALNFFTASTERARITSGGEVYIAGTTDQGAYNLQVNGTGVWGAGAYVNGSDANLKEEVQDLAPALDVIASLRPVTFRYKEEYSKDQNVQPGFIAQELQTAMAGQAYVDGVVQAGPQHLNVAYQSLIPLLTKAIQELKAEFDAYKATHP